MRGTGGTVYSFGDWQLDTRLGELRCAGRHLKLEPRVYDVLVYLIEHRDRTVSYKELIEHIWPGQFVTDAVLARCIVAARRAIGDNGRVQRCIKTLRNRGYRFVAPVEEHIDGQQTAPGIAERVPAPQTMPREGDIPCPQCQHENSVTASFCGACGTRLAPVCPSCGHAASPRTLFCTACGRQLILSSPGTGSPPSGSHGEPRAAQVGWGGTSPAWQRKTEAERRHLTVLFCDVVDSTVLSVGLDPEAYREVIGAYHAACAEVIERFDGHIAQYLGDGLLVYFGYPRAHEDDVQRAVRVGLGIVEALGPLQTRLQQEQGVSLAVRVGIHTGLVVVGAIGEGARHERLALGEVPILAARLQGIAPPNTVLISAATARLVHGWFVCEALGDQALKGFPAPMPVYRVLAESGVQSRLDLVGTEGLTPLVGRDQEVKLLLERWEHAKGGLGQVVLLSGEAGIGKSRLVRAVQDSLAGEPYTRLECRCSPYAQHSALYPVIDLGRRLLQWQRDEAPDVTLSKLEAALAPYDVSPPEVVPLMASLLSLPPSDRYPLPQLSPQRQRQKTLEAILALLLAHAAQRPVLFIVEDLHWVDPSTLELLTLFIDQGPKARILTLFTARPEFRPPWGLRAQVTSLTLDRLPPTQVELMIEGVTGGKRLPAAVRQQVVAKTDGVPLFVEELTKTVIESGLLREQADHYELPSPLPSIAIPTTLHDSLMARLDRLADAKEVAQLGATLGRAFPYELLQAVSPWDEDRLQQALGQLVEAGLLYQFGAPPEVAYAFKHALIQETAYQSLLKSQRQQYHRQTAPILEQRFPEIAETQPELLAHHYTEAGLPAQALPYWQRAGQRAVERSANVEAISHFTKGLELLKTLPDTPERVQQELTLQLALGSPLLMIKGHTASEVEQVYNRALNLCQRVGDSPQRFSALMGLWRFYFSRARLRTARDLSEQCFTVAQRMQDPVLLHEAHVALGSTLFHLGELTAARSHLEQGMALYDPQRCRALAFSRGLDTGVVCLSRMAWTLWMLGYPDQALTRTQQALTLARESSHAYSLGFALHFAALLHIARREPRRVQEQAEAVIALSRAQGFVLWLSGGMVTHGWALVEQGAVQEGIEQLRQGMTAWWAMGNYLGRPQLLARLAEAYGRSGQITEGIRVLDDALATIHENAEQQHEAEIYRLKGQLLLQPASRASDRCLPSTSTATVAEAEACFLQALDIARRQEAKSWELRAATNLSRLRLQQGERAAARQMLVEIYSWFTEGFDTPDLQEAKTLLAVLA
jgi:class 3 adenylate cyclase/DNA-binding winged helix-turn-helix (wHTH) protein/tetratricopeptide (TPR) repeat protein